MTGSGQGRTGRMVTDGTSAGSRETVLKGASGERGTAAGRSCGEEASCHFIPLHAEHAVKGPTRRIVPAVTEGGRGPRRLALTVHVLVLVGGFSALLSCTRGQWFYGDEWDFLGHRGLAGAERSLWAPHNEHWSTGPILIYRGLYA